MVEIIVRGPRGREASVTAMVDTGFNGPLLLPAHQVATLGLPVHSYRTVQLADGSTQNVINHAGRVLWEGIERPVRVVAAGQQPLIGMALLVGYRLCLDVVDGAKVEVTPLSDAQ